MTEDVGVMEFTLTVIGDEAVALSCALGFAYAHGKDELGEKMCEQIKAISSQIERTK